MKLSSLVVVSVLCVTALCPPVRADGSRVVESAGGFSYTPPPGWAVRELPGLKYRIDLAPTANGFSANINLVDEHFSGSLEDYIR